MNGIDEWQRQTNERMKNPPPTLRELFLKNLMEFPSNYCTTGEALKAFDDALAVVRSRESFWDRQRTELR